MAQSISSSRVHQIGAVSRQQTRLFETGKNTYTPVYDEQAQ